MYGTVSFFWKSKLFAIFGRVFDACTVLCVGSTDGNKNTEMEEKQRTGPITSQAHVRYTAQDNSRMSLDNAAHHVLSGIRRQSLWTGKRRMSRRMSRKSEQILVSQCQYPVSLKKFVVKFTVCNV